MKKIFRRKCCTVLILLVLVALGSTLFNSCKQYKLSYRRGLKKNATYAATLPKPDINFEYASSEDSNLVFLREKYKLDSVAGHGTEIERIINLMLWVHGLTSHAANPSYPGTLSSLNLIDLSMNENKALNCVMHAIILNDVYLSMGFKSRYIHLRYKYSGESHAVNSVYSTTLRKWIMMDSDMGAFCMDEKGGILNIPEIRQKLIKKEKIIFNNELEVPVAGLIKFMLGGTQKSYRWYLSKNIFMYTTNLKSEFNFYGDRARDIIRLVPTNYLDKLKMNDRESPFENKQYYYTDDEEFFWQHPTEK